jgi:methylenetetrahydrofolate dehydrogenase (NADP+)/methenyltetrahydrofolate cyclohydrolase
MTTSNSTKIHSTLTDKLLYGTTLAKELREHIAIQAQKLTALGHQPGLAVVLVGQDPASQVYVKNKVLACEKAGFHSVMHQLNAQTTEIELITLVNQLNHDKAIHGILVQLPLPAHINAHRVIETIAPEKDVDGFHVSNAGLLMTGQPLFRPCTPYGVMKLLEWSGIDLKGAEAVVVGASNIVGKPQAMLLLQAGATVTICNSKTKHLATHTQRADVLVVAVGKPNFITGDMIKPGAVVIDVGINRLANGKLCGDVEFDSAKEVASFITPVPGGVGPMTITMLLQNTIEAVERTMHHNNS